MRVLALLLLANPALTQDLTIDDCNAIAAAAMPAISQMNLPLTLQPITAQDGWCQYTDIRIEPQAEYQPRWTIRSLRFRGDGLAAVPVGNPPATLDVELRGGSLQVVTGDPDMDYLMALQRADFGIDLDLAAAYDPATRILRIDRLDVDFPGPDIISFTAQVDRLDLRSMAGMQSSVGAAGLTSLGLTVTSNGLFENYLLLPLGSVLLDGKPATLPAADYIAGMITGARTTVAGLPATLIDAPSKTALDSLLADMPNPWGTLELDAQAPAGFGTPRLMGFAMSGLPATLENWLPVFSGVTVTATYTPSPKED